MARNLHERRKRRQERNSQRDQERREAIRKAETLEDLLDIFEQEYEEEVEDEDGETRTITRTRERSGRFDQLERIVDVDPPHGEPEAVNRGRVSQESKDDAEAAYEEGDALELARLAFEVVSGHDPAGEE